MAFLVERITDFDRSRAEIRARRYGVIESTAGEAVAIHLRPWPKLLSLPELIPMGARYHARGERDRCLVYYNQPRRMPNYLALRYMVSTSGTSYGTFRSALRTLDRIAALKGIDAIVCDAANVRLSERLMTRLGWEPHKPSRWHRNYIRRFYGVYPAGGQGDLVGGSRETGGRGLVAQVEPAPCWCIGPFSERQC